MDRAAVAALGLAGFVLSLDALRQMAAASHVRPSLTWLFPLILDGFIAYSVRALLVLRHAPLPARAYVWCLLATATGVSIWANVLHAVVLNRHAFSSAPVTHGTSGAGLELGDDVVGVLAACAPLALAAAVHLHTLIARHTAPAAAPEPVTEPVPQKEPDPSPLVAARRLGQARDDSPARDESTRHHHGTRTSPDQARDESQRAHRIKAHPRPTTSHRSAVRTTTPTTTTATPAAIRTPGRTAVRIPTPRQMRTAQSRNSRRIRIQITPQHHPCP
nr:DUF2637 domain-containing protein [Yinghuangia sp. ASG 101]